MCADHLLLRAYLEGDSSEAFHRNIWATRPGHGEEVVYGVQYEAHTGGPRDVEAESVFRTAWVDGDTLCTACRGERGRRAVSTLEGPGRNAYLAQLQAERLEREREGDATYQRKEFDRAVAALVSRGPNPVEPDRHLNWQEGRNRRRRKLLGWWFIADGAKLYISLDGRVRFSDANHWSGTDATASWTLEEATRSGVYISGDRDTRDRSIGPAALFRTFRRELERYLGARPR